MTSKEFVLWLKGFTDGVHEYPYNPYKITSTPGTTITTTPGSGSITIANPPFGFGSTSTAYGYTSGSAWSYTNGGNNIKD